MSQYTPATLESLISITGEADHASILKHANNVLKSEKSHKQVLHTKAVALINLDRYDDAFSVLSAPELAGEAVLERAYCLYKLGRLEDALAAAVDGAGGGGRDERGLKHVEAQAVWVPPIPSIDFPTANRGGMQCIGIQTGKVRPSGGNIRGTIQGRVPSGERRLRYERQYQRYERTIGLGERANGRR